MYIPQHYNEDSWDKKKQFIREFPLATVITIDADGVPIANHFPFYLHEDDQTGKKYLYAHVAKKISPSYYPEKERTHKFVPTWDFAALHLYGRSRVIDDFDFVRAQLNLLTDQQEASRECPWKVDDAPENYTKLMQKAITGLEIEISETACKYKFEQKMSQENIEGTIKGLACDGRHQVSNFVREANT